MLTRWFARPRTSGPREMGVSERVETVSRWGVLRFARFLSAALVASGLLSAPARAQVTYNGSSGGIVFGATKYGPPAQTDPVWIHNNFTNLNDILASPGGGALLANPVIPNNIVEVGPTNFQSIGLTWAGGTSGDGSPFGAGSAAIFGPQAFFALTDATAGGGGTASYGIESWKSSYALNGDFTNSTFGTYLSINASVPLAGSAAIAAMQTEVDVLSADGKTTLESFTLNPLILAIDGAGKKIGEGDKVATPILLDASSNTWSLLAEDEHNTDANFAAGNQLLVTSTITFYADPASIDTTGPNAIQLNEIGGLPDLVLGGTAVPEPGSMVLGGTAVLALSLVGWMRRAARRKAA